MDFMGNDWENSVRFPALPSPELPEPSDGSYEPSMSPIISPAFLGLTTPAASEDMNCQELCFDPLLVQSDEASLASLETWSDNISAPQQATYSAYPSLPRTPDPPFNWDASIQSGTIASSTESCLQACLQLSQLSTSQIQSLCGRVQALEQSLKDTEGKIEDFLSWSKKMEKHCQETTNTVLSLFKTIQKPEFMQDVLKEPGDHQELTR